MPLKFYLFIYSLVVFLSRLACKDRIEFNSFLKDLQINSVELSKFKNFQNQSIKVFKFLRSLVLNQHSYRALAVVAFAATADYTLLRNNLLQSQISKAIQTGLYSADLLKILRENPALLKIAVDNQFISMMNEFSALTADDIPALISDINQDSRTIISTGNVSFIPRQIISLMTILYLTGQVENKDYSLNLLNFLSGKGISDSLKKLLKELIKSHNIIFITKFFDY